MPNETLAELTAKHEAAAEQAKANFSALQEVTAARNELFGKHEALAATVAELQAALLRREDALLRTFTRNLMAYAIGRRIEAYDMPTVRAKPAQGPAVARAGPARHLFMRQPVAIGGRAAKGKAINNAVRNWLDTSPRT